MECTRQNETHHRKRWHACLGTSLKRLEHGDSSCQLVFVAGVGGQEGSNKDHENLPRGARKLLGDLAILDLLIGLSKGLYARGCT